MGQGIPREGQVSLVLLLVVGVAAGFLATRLMKIETGVAATLAIGVGGALIGGVLIRFLLEITGWMAGFVGAVLGALLLLWIWKTYIAGR
jgi:uncharacterized membrane protein YeaQ/YmgE (transglycosylase-associated protein family)